MKDFKLTILDLKDFSKSAILIRINRQVITMGDVSIEINIEEEEWLREIPEAEDYIKKSCIAAVKAVKISGYTDNIEVSVLLTNDDSIKKLNHDYRGKDKPTNVLSFPLEEFEAGEYEYVEGDIALGDVIFALETIQNEAKEQEKPILNHLSHLAVHGTLHLLGYDHEEDDEAEIMEALEIEILSQLGIESPY